MAAEPSWVEVASPPGGAVRGLGVHAGAPVALTMDGLFTSADRGATWAPLALDAARLSTGKLVFGAHAHETMAFAIAPDGAWWRGIRATDLAFYPAPDGDGRVIHHAATMTAERVEVSRDGGATWSNVRELAARDLAFDARGRVWVAATSGLEVLDGDTWRTALRHGARCVGFDAGGAIVVGTATTGYRSLDGDAFAALPPRATEQGAWGSLDLDAENLAQVERGPDDALWGRISGGVLRFDRGRWTSRNLGLAIVARVGARRVLRVTAIAFVGQDVYAGTDGQGLFRRTVASPRG